MSARAFGRGVGRAGGWVGAKVVSVSIAAFEGAGQLGEGVLEGATESYETTRAKDEIAREARKQRIVALLASKREAEAALAQHPRTMAVSSQAS